MNRTQRLAKLNEIYSRIPKIQCKKGCHECCGCTRWLPVETENIKKFLLENNIKERFAKSFLDYCPYIEDDKCLIYPVIPIVCRFFGVIKKNKGIANMECPHSKPERFLSEEESYAIFEEIAKLKNH